MEVMGLMLGEFVDECVIPALPILPFRCQLCSHRFSHNFLRALAATRSLVFRITSYTIICVDVFAMPQSGTSVSVESVDPVFQTKMLEMLKAVNRPEMVVGWYHSHPGFGCWLSGVDVNTQQSFEQLNKRAVAVVIDPIQSVKGKVVIDAFRLINQQAVMFGQEYRQNTSNQGYLKKPSIQALVHNLNRHYYSINISYRKNELEQKMLLNLHKKTWTDGLAVEKYDAHTKKNGETVKTLLQLTKEYSKWLTEEETKSADEVAIMNVGKRDPKRHLEADAEEVMAANVVQSLGTMLNTIIF